MSNPKKNFIYNLIYQVLMIIISFITAPYLARVVGADGVGIYSYTYSIVYYFMLLTLLGVNNYGNRSIAKVSDDKEKLSKTFWSIYLFQLFMGIIMILLYIGYIFIFDNNYRNYALIETLFIISAILDINWFFFGIEEFKKTIVRNSFVKIANLILIFLLVKTSSDLWKYVLIMSGMTCLSQLILWGFLKNKINFTKVSLKDILKHLKPNLLLFIPVIAISLYKTMDKIMLGIISNVTEVGYYENAERITQIPMVVILALGTVMLPRISNIFSKGKDEEALKYIKKSVSFVMFMSYAMCFGLIGIGYNFAPLYLGNDFQKTGILLMLLALTLPCLSLSSVIRMQYLIPKERDKIYVRSILLGAITNFTFNILLIPKYTSIGACIGTVAAEIAVTSYQTLSIRKEIPILKYLCETISFFIKSFIMLIIIYLFNYIDMNNLLRLLIQILLGCMIYVLFNYKYILSIINIKKIISHS